MLKYTKLNEMNQNKIFALSKYMKLFKKNTLILCRKSCIIILHNKKTYFNHIKTAIKIIYNFLFHNGQKKLLKKNNYTVFPIRRKI